MAASSGIARFFSAALASAGALERKFSKGAGSIMRPRAYSVLVVDDDEDLIDLMQRSLTRMGHFTVHIATDGSTGLAQYYAHRPDCMIIDIRMPGLDGYQLVKALRGDPDSASTPLILLTALVTD